MGSIIRPSLLPLCYCMVTVQCSAVRGQGERLNTLRVLLLLLLLLLGNLSGLTGQLGSFFHSRCETWNLGNSFPAALLYFFLFFFLVVPSQRLPTPCRGLLFSRPDHFVGSNSATVGC